MSTTTAPAPSATDTGRLPERVHVLVIGAGFAGLGTAIRLDESGFADFCVVDRGADVGGTWRDNTYPGAACDVPSQLYSFSFAPNPSWSRSFSPQPEIHAYLEDVARRAGVLDRFHFGVSAEEAVWDDERAVWRVRTSAGTVEADIVVSGAGGLSEPKLPEIPGIDSFTGRLFHTARWDHDADLAGKRVAVIGTGASAIQVVPALAPTVGHLDLYQRTAPWVLPRGDRAYTRIERLAFHAFPPVQRLYRAGIYWSLESRVPIFTRTPRAGKVIGRVAQGLARRHIASAISDPGLRAKVTPRFEIGCKRILISDDYYPALARDNVEVITEGIAEITPTGVRTRDGVEHPVDAIVVATGFYTTDIPIAHHITGREGRTLAEVWGESGMTAYKGTTVHGFPNLFLLVGPNTGLGHSSMVFIIESQIAYVLDAVRTLGARGLAAVEPTRAAQDAWTADVRKRMRPTVWLTGGCASWYLDEHGNNTTLWPRSTVAFRRLLARFDLDQYATTRRASTTPSREQVAS